MWEVPVPTAQEGGTEAQRAEFSRLPPPPFASLQAPPPAPVSILRPSPPSGSSHAPTHLLELSLLHDACLLGGDDTTWEETHSCEAGEPGSPSPPIALNSSSPPFLGPRFRSEAAAAALLFPGFRAWNLRCPCAMMRHAPEKAGLGENTAGRRRARWDTVGPAGRAQRLTGHNGATH